MIDFLKQHVLSLIILLPLLGAGVVALLSQYRFRVTRWIGLIFGLIPLALWLWMLRHFRGVGGFEFSEFMPWIKNLGISCWLACDGISIFAIGGTLIIVPILISLLDKGEQRSIALLLGMEAFLVGALGALDLFQFLFFLELAGLLFLFFVGLSQSQEAATKIKTMLVFQLMGSAMLWLCALVVSSASGKIFHLTALMREPLDLGDQVLWAKVFFFGVGLKVALIPVHVWFRKIESTLSIPVTVLFINAVLYGVLRFMPVLFPGGLIEIGSLISVIAVISVLLSGLFAFAAQEFRVKIIYFAIGQVSWVLLGFSILHGDAFLGALYLMLSYSLVATALSVLASKRFPPWLLFIVLLAAIGFPGTNIFVGMFLIAVTGYKQNPTLISLGLAGWFFMAIGLMRGQLFSRPESSLKEPSSILHYAVLLVPLLILIWLGGIVPSSILERSETSVTKWMTHIHMRGEKGAG